MEKNYYDETVEKITDLIVHKKYEEAYSIVITELTLPYVPEDYLPKFQAFKSQILDFFKKSDHQKLHFEIAELFRIIHNDEKVLLGFALSSLENVALINHLNQIIEIFNSLKINNEVKGLIYEICVKQEINKDFVIDSQIMNPHKLGSIGMHKNYQPLWKEIETLCDKDQTMINVAYFIYNKYLINNFVLLLNQQLDLDISYNILQLTKLFMNQITEQELDKKSLAIMNLFK